MRYTVASISRHGTVAGYDIIDTVRGERITRLGELNPLPDRDAAQQRADLLNLAYDGWLAGCNVENCFDCAANLKGEVCSHPAVIDRYPYMGRAIIGYPAKPDWCPGFIPPDDNDYEGC